MKILAFTLYKKEIIKKTRNMLTLEQKLCIIVYVGLRNAVVTNAKAQDKK